MALQTQVFDHDSPGVPTLANGMLLGASGVNHPPLQTIGSLAGLSSADGSFNDQLGLGQIDYDSAGAFYVADYSNNRVQKFVKNSSGVWNYHSKLTGVAALLGGATPACELVAIDRVNNEIHIGSGDYFTTSNWISVWSLSNWPTLTTLNRLRQYGANGNTNTAGRANTGRSLAVDGTVAIVCSSLTGFRLLRWNHQTNTLLNEETQNAAYARFTHDGAGNWFCAARNPAAEVGLRSIDVTTFTGITRFDLSYTSVYARPRRLPSIIPCTPSYYGGRVYVRDALARCLAFAPTGDGYVDEFVSVGSLGANNALTGESYFSVGAEIQARSSIVVDQDGCAWWVSWNSHADNGVVQSFLMAWPVSTVTATWVKTDWSASVNTLHGLALPGSLVAGEKYKIGLQKNAGAEVFFTSADLFDQTKFDQVGTLTSGDSLTVKLYSSTWDALDGVSGFTACRDKRSPTNQAPRLLYNDPSTDTYVPYASGAYEGEAGDNGAYEGEVGTSGSYEGEFGE